MDDVIVALKNAIDEVASITKDVKVHAEQIEVNDFIGLCQNFVETRTRYMIMKNIEENETPNKFSQGNMNELQMRNENMIQEIRNVQREIQNIKNEDVESLIANCQRTLNILQTKTKQTKETDVDELVNLAQSELNQLDEISKAGKWYQAAYKKLSEFTGIEVINENTLKLFGQYEIAIFKNTIQIVPNDVYIDDIDPSQELIGVCVSEIIERISALSDFKEISRKLEWNLNIYDDAPIVELTNPLSPNKKALFALIGYEIHPLIEWGNIDVEEFNNKKQPLLAKIQSYKEF